MLLSLPLLNPLLPVPVFYSLFLIIAFSVVAGFTSPSTTWALWLNEGIAIIAVIVFEYYAVQYFNVYSPSSALFLVTQFLALNFLIALYYNTKTLRGVVSTR